MKILLLSRYGRLGASSRLRSLQYLPAMEQAGLEITWAPLFPDSYVEALYAGRRTWRDVLKAFWKRLYVLRSDPSQFDLIWLEVELFPWLPSWVEARFMPSGLPWIVDYDDAIFHRYDQHRLRFVRQVLGQKIDNVMRRSNLVVAGNEYLAEHAHRAGATRVEIVPTVVDVERYSVRGAHARIDATPVVVGWIGSPSTMHYLKELAPVFKRLNETLSVRFVAVGARADQLSGLPIEAREWSEESEIAEIQAFDIGIMPLPDEPWSRGKCGYKLIQYMACGLPVVASPVGVNPEIVQSDRNGFLANTHEEWVEALTRLIQDDQLRMQFGAEGRKRVESHYSLQVQASRMIKFLRSVAGNN